MTGELLMAFGAGLLIAMLTTPVGVSGAVFLLPVQLSLLGVPSPAVTPTNLMFNVIAVPGALLRFSRSRPLRSPLTMWILLGTLPGVIAGAVVRIVVIPDGAAFRLVVAAVLLPLGCWLLLRRPALAPADDGTTLRPVVLITLGAAAGLLGGVYGIGGGSLLAPVLVGIGYSTARVAPAALLATFWTSVVGLATYVVLGATGQPTAMPVWSIAVGCGVGGLIGGFAGAALQPRLPTQALTRGLGAVCLLIALGYIVAFATG